MSIKRMVTKLALAFAAKKGMEAFQSVGGMNGLKSAMQSGGANAASRGATGTASAGTSGVLGSVLDAFNGGSDAQPASPTSKNPSVLDQSFGSLVGMLTGALGNRSDHAQAAQDLDNELDVDDHEDDATNAAIVRAMVHAARADGAISDDEQATLLDLLDDATTAERNALTQAMREPVNPVVVAADTPPHARKEVYAAALLVSDPNQPEEMRYLSTLASALGLEDAEMGRIHIAMGKTRH